MEAAPRGSGMKYSDAGFEEFQKTLNEFRESDPLLWRLRDSLYAAICYRMIGFKLERRHSAGLWSWAPWVAYKAVQSISKDTKQLSPDAKFGFLFYGSHSAHFETLLPVVKEIAQEHEVIVWSLALEAKQVSMLSEIRNVHVVPLANPFAAASMLDHAIVAIRATFRLGEIFAEQKSNIAAHRSLLAQTVFDYLGWKQFWRRIPPGCAASAVFVTSESSVIAKAFMESAMARGARAVHFCHGLRNAVHQVTVATDLCALSEMDHRWFAERVDKTTSVRAIGNPRIESIRAAVSLPRPRHLGEPFRLLFLSTGIEDPYTEEMMRGDCSILALDKTDRAKYIVRVRPHPRESVAELARILQENRVTVDEFSSGSLIDDLAWCDAAATQCSTSLLEAAVAHRPCYWINARADGLCSTGDLQSAGLGQLIRTREQWMEAVEDLCALRIRPPALITDEALDRTRIVSDSRRSWLEKLHI